MTTSTLRLTEGKSNAWPSRTSWQISKCSPSTCGVWLGAGALPSGGAAISDWSTGQPAATEPATTNLMKSRREFGDGVMRLAPAAGLQFAREDLAAWRRDYACECDTRSR